MLGCHLAMNEKFTSEGEIHTARGFAAEPEANRVRMGPLHRKKIPDPSFFAKIRSDRARHAEDAMPTMGFQETTSESIPGERARKIWRRRMLCLLAAMAMAGALLAALGGYAIGHWRGRAAVNQEVVAAHVRTMKRLPEKNAALLYQAMSDLRAGKAEDAFGTIKSLRTQFPQVASLSYLSALAALQSGQFKEAESFVTDSIKAGERISDSLALLSTLERQKAPAYTKIRLAEGGRKAEDLLRAAITADAANPNPHLELSNVLRESGRREEAVAELRAAQALLNPVESHLVMDLTLALMEIEQAPKENLTVEARDSGDVRKLFPAAYTAMRLDDLPLAASLLGQCRELVPANVFDYMMGDPALRQFRERPEFQPFFEN